MMACERLLLSFSTVADVLRLRSAACTSCCSSLLLLTSLPSKDLAGPLLLPPWLYCLTGPMGFAWPGCASAWPGSAATRSVNTSCKHTSHNRYQHALRMGNHHKGLQFS
ncbi:hypothetical protein COO60DRAFT_744964 [Scenedesmus sp. NREL 46B-D3]|nr:hypothetical protein COO60DRAFT_744964 [Scenedesmus sp. NREL 46B-D3]